MGTPGVVTEAEARYLAEIADDCERCLGPETKLMEPKVILDHVKEWNAQRRVVINTVAMDLKTDDGRAFLKDLAHENGGTFVGK